MPSHRLSGVVVLLLAATLAACSAPGQGPTQPALTKDVPAARLTEQTQSELNGTQVNPAVPRPTQTLRDTSGQPFSLADRPMAELTVLFFGYTHCPDVCPTTMADLANARSQVPAQLRDNVTVVFVTEDPERDTPRSLHRWLAGFDPSFVGLLGHNAATRAMLKQLYLPQTKQAPQPDEPVRHPHRRAPRQRHGEYGVEHAGIVYAFGPDGSTVIYSGGTEPGEYAADFTRLLETAPGDSR